MYELLFSTNKKAMELFGRKQAYSYFSESVISVQTPLELQEYENRMVWLTMGGRRLIIAQPISDRQENGFRVIQTNQFTYVFAANQA